MRYKIVLQYDGGGYHGWQAQPHQPLTVQNAVENAVEKVLEKRVTVTASGRTDEGVHALGQVAHFDSEKELPSERMLQAINHWLPEDIRVVFCERVSDNFDARKSAKRKTYEYRMYESETPNPLRRTREAFVGEVDVEKMDEASKLFVGVKDLAGFRSSGSSAKTTVREIYSASVTREGGSVIFRVTGSGFLYNTVRIMAGALIRVGQGRMDKGVIEQALACGDRRLVPDIAPSCGLYLKNVEYSAE